MQWVFAWLCPSATHADADWWRKIENLKELLVAEVKITVLRVTHMAYKSFKFTILCHLLSVQWLVWKVWVKLEKVNVVTPAKRQHFTLWTYLHAASQSATMAADSCLILYKNKYGHSDKWKKEKDLLSYPWRKARVLMLKVGTCPCDCDCDSVCVCVCAPNNSLIRYCSKQGERCGLKIKSSKRSRPPESVPRQSENLDSLPRL